MQVRNEETHAMSYIQARTSGGHELKVNAKFLSGAGLEFTL